MRRGVNALESSRRRRVCTGGSVVEMFTVRKWSMTVGISGRRSAGSWLRKKLSQPTLEKISQVRATSVTSSPRVTSHCPKYGLQ